MKNYTREKNITSGSGSDGWPVIWQEALQSLPDLVCRTDRDLPAFIGAAVCSCRSCFHAKTDTAGMKADTDAVIDGVRKNER